MLVITTRPDADARRLDIVGTAGVGRPGSGAADALALGQHVGELGPMDLLTKQAGRASSLRANAVELVLALDNARDRSARQVIDGLA